MHLGELSLGFRGGSGSKGSVCNAGNLGSIFGSGRSPGKGNGNPLQYSHLENSKDGGAWQSFSPWGQKESDTTEQLTQHNVYPAGTVLDGVHGVSKVGHA